MRVQASAEQVNGSYGFRRGCKQIYKQMVWRNRLMVGCYVGFLLGLAQELAKDSILSCSCPARTTRQARTMIKPGYSRGMESRPECPRTRTEIYLCHPF